MSRNIILEKLEGVKNRFEEVEQLIAEPEIIADMKTQHLTKITTTWVSKELVRCQVDIKYIVTLTSHLTQY